jgi:hypothetical protein
MPPRRARLSARFRHPITITLVVAVTLLTGAVIVPTGTASAAVPDGDWLGIVNAYRAMSGLTPVTEQSTWSAQARDHSCYMLQNGMAHGEEPGRPGYTAGGDAVARNGNLSIHSSASATARHHIDTWMTGPFHAIGLLRPGLATTGLGICSGTSTPTGYGSAATIDVLRGIDASRERPTAPVVFPGNGASIALDRSGPESPDPVAMCGWGGEAGLPLIALLPNTVSAASASLKGPSGDLQTCVLHAGNVSDPIAKSILSDSNAVVVVPRSPLAQGAHRASVSSDGGSASWSFEIDRGAGLEIAQDTTPSGGPARFDAVAPFRLVDTRAGQGATRLEAGTTTRISVGDASATALSANFVAVHPNANGYLTVFNCGDRRPIASTLNFRKGSVVANQTIVPVDGGTICVYTRATTDLVVDVNGYYRGGGRGDGYHPAAPARLFDSRRTKQLTAGETRRVRIAGASGGAPSAATAVALNVTAIHAADGGWLKVAPCGSATDATISSLNYRANEVRPNSVVVPVGSRGSVCVTSLRDIDVTIDLAGYFTADGGSDYQALAPVRLFDSRSTYRSLNSQTTGTRLSAGEVVRLGVAGERGIPAAAKAASINIAATDPVRSTYITAYPCGKRPNTANVNVSTAQQTIANGAMVKLSPEGDLCLYARADVHVVVDINGIWR